MEEILDEVNSSDSPEYAGFGARFLAVFIDGIIIAIPVLAIQYLVFSPENPIGQLVAIVIQWLYFAMQESSEKQATIGKNMMGLRVTDVHGQRISFGRATGRYFGKILSGVILLIGYLMQPFTEKKQALHDMIAGTLVVK